MIVLVLVGCHGAGVGVGAACVVAVVAIVAVVAVMLLIAFFGPRTR